MAGIVPHVNVLGLTAAQAAWQYGAPWLAAQIDYLRANRDYLAVQIEALPGVTMAKVEATYLAWLDISALNLFDFLRITELMYDPLHIVFQISLFRRGAELVFTQLCYLFAYEQWLN